MGVLPLIITKGFINPGLTSQYLPHVNKVLAGPRKYTKDVQPANLMAGRFFKRNPVHHGLKDFRFLVLWENTTRGRYHLLQRNLAKYEKNIVTTKSQTSVKKKKRIQKHS